MSDRESEIIECLEVVDMDVMFEMESHRAKLVSDSTSLSLSTPCSVKWTFQNPRALWLLSLQGDTQGEMADL